jgi:hypothetical protein
VKGNGAGECEFAPEWSNFFNFLISVEYFNFDAKKIDEDHYNYQAISSFAHN